MQEGITSLSLNPDSVISTWLGSCPITSLKALIYLPTHACPLYKSKIGKLLTFAHFPAKFSPYLKQGDLILETEPNYTD